jgi:hypothetical protein
VILRIIAIADIPGQPEEYKKGLIRAENYEALIDSYKKGNWIELQEKTEKLVNKILWWEIDKKNRCNSDFRNPEDVANYVKEKTKFYCIVLIDKKSSSEFEIIRYIFHDPSPDPYIKRFPGITELYEVILSPIDSILSLKSDYSFTREEDSLVAQIPLFVEKFEPIIFTVLNNRITAAEKGEDVPTIFVEMKKVKIPLKRAEIVIKDSGAIMMGSYLDQIKKRAEEFKDSLINREVYKNKFGIRFASDIIKAINKVCCSAVDCRKAIMDAIKTTYEENLINICDRKKLKTALLVEEKFLQFVANLSLTKGSAEFKYKNSPLTRFSFGLVSSYMFGALDHKDRSKLEEGIYQPNPLRGNLTMAIVNIHPCKYDQNASKMTREERFRLFVGGVLTPEIGIGGGIGFGILRGLTVNLGCTVLRIDTPKSAVPAIVDEEKIGTKPGYPNDPFKSEPAFVFFFGFGYNFK